MSPIEHTVCSNAPGSAPAPCSIALTSLTLWRTVSSMLSSCIAMSQPRHNLVPSCADCDLVLSIAVDKVLSPALGVLSSLLVQCHIHLLTPLTPNRIYHHVQHSWQDGPGLHWFCHNPITLQNPIPLKKLLCRLPDPGSLLCCTIVSSTLQSAESLPLIVTMFPFVSSYYFLPIPLCYPLPLFLV